MANNNVERRQKMRLAASILMLFLKHLWSLRLPALLSRVSCQSGVSLSTSTASLLVLIPLTTRCSLLAWPPHRKSAPEAFICERAEAEV